MAGAPAEDGTGLSGKVKEGSGASITFDAGPNPNPNEDNR
jgi:hypothetical protein